MSTFLLDVQFDNDWQYQALWELMLHKKEYCGMRVRDSRATASIHVAPLMWPVSVWLLLLYPISALPGKHWPLPRVWSGCSPPGEEGASGINEIYTWREDSSKRAESSKALNFPINQQQLGLKQNPNTGFTGIAAPLGKIVRGGKKKPRQLVSSNQNGINLQLFQYMECWTYLQRQRVHFLQMN